MSNVIGRPLSIDDITLKKLEDAFSNGATDVQACFLADISGQTLYNYQKAHPDFIERKQALKDMIAYQAKIKIKQAITEDKNSLTAQWYLDRRDADFKPKQELSGELTLVDLLKDKYDDTRESSRKLES